MGIADFFIGGLKFYILLLLGNIPSIIIFGVLSFLGILPLWLGVALILVLIPVNVISAGWLAYKIFGWE